MTKKMTPQDSKNLLDDEAFYKSLFDNTLDGIAYCEMIFDVQEHPIDFSYILVNKNFEALTGLKGAEGKRVTKLIPGITKSNPELFEIYGRVSLSGKPERFEVYVGPISRWLLISVYSPKKNFFVAVFQNITERKQVEKNFENAKIAAVNVLEDLQAEKDRLAYAKAKDEAMLASIGDGVIIVDLVGKITFMNQAAQMFLGWKMREVEGKLLFDVVSIEDENGEQVPAEEQPIATALAIGTTTTTTEEGRGFNDSEIKTISGVYYYARKDETRFPVSVTVAPVILQNKIVGAIEIFHDITKEKEVDKAKTEFVSLASHQLRSPITIIKWYTEMILSGDAGPLTEQQKKHFDEIHRGNQRMADLVDALLNVSRLELGTFSVEPEQTNIGELVQGVIDEQKVTIKQKKISLKTTVASSLPMAYVDPRLLRMVITNIFSNSIKYTPEKGTIEYTVRTVKKGELIDAKKMTEDSFAIKIVDTGCGIPKEQQERIFTKLFRADNVRKLNTDGTGLGLYIAKAIMDHSGGLIWFESEENKGTTFYVTLPITGMKKNEGLKRLS